MGRRDEKEVSVATIKSLYVCCATSSVVFSHIGSHTPLSYSPFHTSDHNVGLSLNVDWFRPFKHSPYSVGVIYLSIMNLPRELRFQWENVMVYGIIPGPTEPG